MAKVGNIGGEKPDTVAAGVDMPTALLEHAPALLAAARAMSMDRLEAEDLVQSTFETALRKIDQLRDPAALRPWLFRIQTREALRLRRRFRGLASLNSARLEPAGEAIRSAEHLAVREALGSLGRRTRIAVVLHHMIGLSVAETADSMGISQNTVKTQLRTGMALLRERLADG